jgi:hypothetical protein
LHVKDKIKQGKIVVEHCPTDQKWTNINTKPKQEAVICQFHGQVMGIPPTYNDISYKHHIYLRPPEHGGRGNLVFVPSRNKVSGFAKLDSDAITTLAR